MKNMLVIGTSHSESSCQRVPGGSIEKFMVERWFDFIQQEYNIDDVVNLSRSNCTVDQQFAMIYNYFKINPEKRFKYCIIEGRAVESTVSTPNHVNNLSDHVDPNSFESVEDLYYSWSDEYRRSREIGTIPKKFFDRFDVMDSRVTQDDGVKFFYNDWYADYAHSYLHCFQHWSANLAMIKFLEKYCEKVIWYSFSTSKNFHDPQHPMNLLAKELIGDWSMFDKDDEKYFPVIQWDETYSEPQYNTRCECGHLNENGMRKFFYEKLKPRLDYTRFFD